MGIRKFYADEENCINAIIHVYGDPDQFSKYGRKMNFFYIESTDEKRKVELFIHKREFIDRIRGLEPTKHHIEETMYYEYLQMRRD